MTTPPLFYGHQWIDDDDIWAVAAQLRDDWLTQGPTVARFEATLAEYCGAKHAVAVSSGTAALHLAALAAGVGPDRMGITSAITFVASANCIAYARGTPAFADVDPETALIDVKDLEDRCDNLAERKTPPVAIIPVDFAGQPADLPAVRRVADRHGAAVIEDAAHALGASYRDGNRDIRCGSCTHTELAVLSFHPVKHITTGEGGAVLTNDNGLHQRLLELRTHGITTDPSRLTRNDGPWYHEEHSLGFNYRLTDFQSALGLSQMQRLDFFLARRRELAARYDAALSWSPFAERLVPLEQRTGACNAYHLYVVRLLARAGESPADVAEHRLNLFNHLIANQIRPQVHYIPVPRQPFFRKEFHSDPKEFPGAETYYSGCLSLPLYPAMTDDDVEHVLDALSTAEVIR